jgi:hypothetical protein
LLQQGKSRHVNKLAITIRHHGFPFGDILYGENNLYIYNEHNERAMSMAVPTVGNDKNWRQKG